LLRFIASLLLLPLCAAVFLAAADVLRVASEVEEIFSAPVIAFGGGFFAWVATYFCLSVPMKIYVFGHEVTHALWGLLFGARVGRMKVSDKGGSVMLSKTNLWISLAPYFFPFYTMVAVGVYALASCFWELGWGRLVFLFLTAYTWGFHFTFTIVSLRTRQPDVMEHGRAFSWAVIWLVNVLGLGVWIAAMTPAGFPCYGEKLRERTVAAYVVTWEGCQRMVRMITNF